MFHCGIGTVYSAVAMVNELGFTITFKHDHSYPENWLGLCLMSATQAGKEILSKRFGKE